MKYAVMAVIGVASCLTSVADAAASGTTGNINLTSVEKIGTRVEALESEIDRIAGCDREALSEYREAIEGFESSPSKGNQLALDEAYLKLVTRGIESCRELGPRVSSLEVEIPGLLALVTAELNEAQQQMALLQSKLRVEQLGLEEELDSGLTGLSGDQVAADNLETALKTEMYKVQLDRRQKSIESLESDLVGLRTMRLHCRQISASNGVIARYLAETKQVFESGLELSRRTIELQTVTELVRDTKSGAADIVKAWRNVFEGTTHLVATR